MQSNPITEIGSRTTRGPVVTLDPAVLGGLTVLAVWAHPDDESYLGGGLMADVAASGGRVVNVTATLGEHGTPDPEVMPPRRLASIRRAELICALNALGVGESVVMGFEDASLDSIPVELGARRVGALIDEVTPDVVISFGPDGVTGHPDHIAIGEWTRGAVEDRRDAPALLQTAAGRWMPRDVIDTMAQLGAFFPGFAPEPGRDSDVPVVLSESTVDTKLSALAAHGSQTEPFRALLGERDYRRLAAVEAYSPVNTRAWDLVGATATLSAA